MSNMYSICHYYQVHLPNEAMALQTRGGKTRSPAERDSRHRRNDVIHFIVGKKFGNNFANNQCRQRVALVILCFILSLSVNNHDDALRGRYRSQYWSPRACRLTGRVPRNGFVKRKRRGKKISAAVDEVGVSPAHWSDFAINHIYKRAYLDWRAEILDTRDRIYEVNPRYWRLD